MGECLIIRGGGGTDTSDATATASVVLSGYTCYVNDQLIAGSMPVQTLNQKLGAGGSVTIPAGYYDGSSSVISTSTLAEETAANATAAQILSWYTAWVNGSKITGSMAKWGNTGATLAANGVYWIPAGWHAGAGVVNQSLAVHWGGTYTPNTGNQVMCWAGWYTGGNIVVLGSGNLVPWNIRNGVNIFGVIGTQRGYVDQYMWVIRNGWIVWPYAWRILGNAPTYQSGYQRFQKFYYFAEVTSTIAFYIPGAAWTTCNDWEIQMTGKGSASLVTWIICGSQSFVDELNAGTTDPDRLSMYWAQYMSYDGDTAMGTSDKEVHYGYYNTNYPPQLYWSGWALLYGSGFSSSIDLYVKDLWINMWMVNQDHGV